MAPTTLAPRHLPLAVLLALSLSGAPLSADDEVARSPSGAFATGAVLDMAAYAEAPRVPPLTRGDYTRIPPQRLLESFSPTPGDQGAQGSCVGWAVAYAARTLAEAQSQGVDDRPLIDGTVFSPSFVYNQIHGGDCIESGARIDHALMLLEDLGVPLLQDFPYDPVTCSQPITPRHLALAESYRIAGWRAVTPPGARSGHVPVRRSLAADRPVIIGMAVPPSFHAFRGSAGNGGLWEPTQEEIWDREDGLLHYGHAMTVIGYDDARFGGAFRVINSWGTDWGDGGYFWITYADFRDFVFQAFEMIPREPPPPPVPVEPNIGGSLRFEHIGGAEMTARRSGPLTWRMTEPYPSGTRFRAELTGLHGGQVYVLGGDLTGRYVELFPRDRRTSAILTAGDTLVLPGPTEDHYTRMDDTLGTDFYVVLFARQALDVGAVLARVDAASGDPRARLAAALGERLDSRPELLTYPAGGIGFEASVADEGVVALVVEIEHVAAPPQAIDHDPPRIVVLTPAVDLFHEIATGRDERLIDERRFTLRGIAQDASPIQDLRVEGALSSRFSSLGPFEAVVELPPGASEGAFTITATDRAGNSAAMVLRVSLGGD